MKIFAIRDHEAEILGDLAYLFWYEKAGECSIEIREGVDSWNLPFVLDTYAARGQYTVGGRDTMRFVCQRIVPKDRQNIGMILKDNGLDEYDEMKLLLLADGRCAQDECYLRKIAHDELPDEIRHRRERCMTAAVCDENGSVMVTYADGTIGLVDLQRMSTESGEPANRTLRRLLSYRQLLGEAQLNRSGTELIFPDGSSLTYGELSGHALPLPISREMITALVQTMLVPTQDLTEMLGCSRQNINDMVRRGRLHPLVMNTKEYIFLRSEVQKLL